jgi:hypothetical protein
MPIIRIEGSHTKQSRRQATTWLGGFVGGAFGAKEIGAGIGSLFGNLIDGKSTRPVEIDTETNKLVLLDKRGNPIDSETARILQQVWDTGSVPSNLRQKYWGTAQEIFRQRQDYYQRPAPVSPIETETSGAQYTGDNSMIGIVPPGGFAGFAGMTPASKMAMRVKNFGGTIGGKRRRKKKKASSGGKRKKRASAKRGKKRLVKGSAAAKRFMANLRKRRK